MRLTVEFDQEVDGRWIAEIGELPGVMVYGATRDQAYAAVQTLAFRVLAERLEKRQIPEAISQLEFSPAPTSP